jgi:hypothetical protein
MDQFNRFAGTQRDVELGSRAGVLAFRKQLAQIVKSGPRAYPRSAGSARCCCPVRYARPNRPATPSAKRGVQCVSSFVREQIEERNYGLVGHGIFYRDSRAALIEKLSTKRRTGLRFFSVSAAQIS